MRRGSANKMWTLKTKQKCRHWLTHFKEIPGDKKVFFLSQPCAALKIKYVTLFKELHTPKFLLKNDTPKQIKTFKNMHNKILAMLMVKNF